MTSLTQKQGQAVSGVVSMIKGGAPVTILDGYAGTGKSTILPFIIDDLGFDPNSIAFVAPTGKAAKVMRTKLRTKYSGIVTSTVHSAIYRAKPAPVGKIEADLYEHQEKLQQYLAETGRDDVDPKYVEHLRKSVKRLEMELESLYRDDRLSFQLNVDSLISSASLIVMDERSMANQQMADDLAFFGVPILAIGDPGQLPPVEGEMGFGVKADFHLDEIHRQARDNPIIRLSEMARNGDDIPLGKMGDTVEVCWASDYEHDFDAEVQPKFLVGTNKTRWKYTQMLRHQYGYTDSPKELVGPRAGEPLIITKNNRQYPNLVNGAEAVATTDGNLIPGNATMVMSFEDDDGVTYNDKTVFQGLFEEHYSRVPGKFSASGSTAYRARQSAINIDWAWACTVHKYQGSQADHVVLRDESGCFRRDANRWLYTGITRAAETLKVLL